MSQEMLRAAIGRFAVTLSAATAHATSKPQSTPRRRKSRKGSCNLNRINDALLEKL